MEHVAAKFRTWREAEQASLKEYRRLTPAERLEILFQLRSIAIKDAHADPERLARLIESLNSSGVDYLVVGALALAYHGIPRYSGEFDILVRNSPENARRIESALRLFGFGNLELTASVFVDSYQVIQLGMAPNRIDLVSSITGVSFTEAWAGRVPGEIDGIKVNFIGRADLIRNKNATGRTQDRADVEALESSGEI